MGGNIPHGNFLCGNFPGVCFSGGSLMDGNFPGGSFPDTEQMFLKREEERLNISVHIWSEIEFCIIFQDPTKIRNR